MSRTSSGMGLLVLTVISSACSGDEEDPVVLITSTASWPCGAALFRRAGLFSLLLGLTFATVGESLPWVGVRGGLEWCALTGAVWMRCTVTGGEDGTGSEQLILAGDLGWGVGDSWTGFGDLYSSTKETELVGNAFTWTGSEVWLWLSVAYLQETETLTMNPSNNYKALKGFNIRVAPSQSTECVSQSFDSLQHAVHFVRLLLQEAHRLHLHPQHATHFHLQGWELS